MSETTSNRASTTLTAPYVAGSHVLQVANTAGDDLSFPFPVTPSFRLSLPEVILEVTGITDSTHFAVTAEGVDANSLNGNTAKIAFTAAGITGLIAAGAGGQSGLVLLAELSASSSASLSFTTRNVTGQSGSIFQSDFDEYLVEIINLIPATNTAELYLQFNADTGANYGWAGFRFVSGATGSAGANSGQTQISLTASGSPSNNSNYGIRGSFKLFDPASAIYKGINGDFTFLDSSSNVIKSSVAGFYQVATAVSSLQIKESSGNIASGTIRVYGVSK